MVVRWFTAASGVADPPPPLHSHHRLVEEPVGLSRPSIHNLLLALQS
jgi:hypothetical protein